MKRSLTNIYATKLIKNLYSKSSTATLSNDKIVQNALDIYQNISEQKNHFVINTFLKLCYELDQNDKILFIWNDIESLHQKSDISLPLLLKCCIDSKKIKIDQIMLILEWMKLKKISMNKLKTTQMAKMIAKCGKNKDALILISDFFDLANWQNNIVIATAQINAFGLCEDMDSAKSIFSKINESEMNIVCIGSMMNALLKNEQNENALSLFDKYPNLNNSVTAICAIKAASNILQFDKGEKIIKNYNLQQSKCKKIQSSLIAFYGRCGKLSYAKAVFDGIESEKRDNAILNAMMSAFIQNDQNNEALKLYQDRYNMQNDEISHILALKAYGNIGNLAKGKEIHSKLDNMKMSGIKIKNALISFYGHCKQIADAKNIFYSNSDCVQNPVSINSIMTALVNNECCFEALRVYKKSKNLIIGEDVSHLMAIKACIHCNDQSFGRQIIKKLKNINKKSQICSTLIDFYGHFGEVESAENIFYGMDNDAKCSVNVAVLMNAYIENEKYESAMELFDQNSKLIDANCLNMAIKACVDTENVQRAKEIISEIDDKYFDDIQLKTTMIHFYGIAKDIDSAICMFESIEDNKKNAVTFGAMMKSFLNCSMNKECVDLLFEMRIEADLICFALALNACANGRFYHLGQRIHKMLKANSRTALYKSAEIESNLIAMYSKCGMLDDCKQIFDKHTADNEQSRDILVWNAMICALGSNGNLNEAMEYFERMSSWANEKTFAILLNACSHCGDSALAKDLWFNRMNDEKIQNDVYVMTAFIDCISRSGHLFEAYDLMMRYQKYTKGKEDDEVMHTALMAACQKHKNVLIAQSVYDKIEKKFKNKHDLLTSSSVLLRNLYNDQTKV